MHLNRRTFAASTIATAAGLPAFRALAQSTPVATPISTDLETRLFGVMERCGVPGAVIALASKNNPEPTYIELGVANLETGEPISADMHFRIASVTKTIVSTVVLQLVDEGLLTLDDTIVEILPDLVVVNADRITVRNLLTMRSGLPQFAGNAGYLEILSSDPANMVTIEQIFGLATNLPASAEPNTAFDYNNLNFDILGETIHVLTGMTWHENVQIRICEPLGMINTLMTNTPDLPTPHSNGYGYLDQVRSSDGLDIVPASTPIPDPVVKSDAAPVNDAGAYDLTAFNPTVVGAAGGLISTVRDLIVWADALGNGELISSEMHAEQIDAIPVIEGTPYGYGLGVINLGGLITHNGAINGFQSAVVSSAQFGVSAAVLTNCNPTLGRQEAAFELVAELFS